MLAVAATHDLMKSRHCCVDIPFIQCLHSPLSSSCIIQRCPHYHLLVKSEKIKLLKQRFKNSLRETKWNTLKHVSIISTEVILPTTYHTCDLWVFQQQEEPLSQSGACHLCPSCRQVR